VTETDHADLELGLATILAVVLRIEEKVLRIEQKLLGIETTLTRPATT